MLETVVKITDQQLSSESLDRYCHNHKTTFLASMLLLLMLSVALWSHVPRTMLFAWLCLVVLSQAGQAWYIHNSLSARRNAGETRGNWLPGLLAGSIATGLSWSASLFFMDLNGLGPIAIMLIFALAGITAYAGIAKAEIFLLAMAFELAALLPLGIWLFLQEDDVARFLGIIVLLYLGLLYFLLRQLNEMVTHSQLLRDRNHELVNALARVQTLEREGAMFHSMFEMISDPAVAVHDPNDGARIIYANDAACRHFGAERETLLGWHPTDFDVRITPEKEALMHDRLANNGRFAFQSVHRRTDGTEVPVEVVMNVFRYEGTELIVTFIRNIASRLAAEKRMHELELASVRQEGDQRISRYLECVPGLFFTLRRDHDGVMSMPFARGSSPSFQGLSPEIVAESIEPLLARCHPDDVDPLLAELHAAAQEMRSCRAEFRIGDPAQRQMVMELTAQPLRCAEPGVMEWHGFMQDITGRKKMEELLRMKEHALDHSSEAMYLIGERGRFVYVNEQACRSLGYSRDELLTMGIADIDPDFSMPLLHGRSEKIQAGGNCFVFETSHQRRDGSTFPVEIQTSELEYNGQVLGMTLVRDITERKRIETELSQRAQEFRSLAESAPDSIIRYDRDGRIRYLNERLARQLGLGSQDIVVGKRPGEIWPDGRFSKLEAAVARVVASGEKTELELAEPDGKGGWLHHWISVVPEQDVRGDIIGTIAFGRNVAERKRMEMELAVREREFRSLAENSPDAIYRYDRQCRRIYANRTVERLTGIPREAMLGKAPVEFMPNPSVDAIRVQQCIQSVLDGGGSSELEFSFVGADGQEATIHNVFVPEFDEEGNVHSVLAIGRDITERKRAEDALRDSETFLRSLMDAIPLPLFYKDKEGRYLGFNKTYGAFTGARREEIVGKTVFDFTPREVAEVYQAKDSELYAQGGSQEYEFKLRNAQGELRDVIISKALFTDGRGEVRGLIGTAIDITERKKMEGKLIEREAFLEAMLNAIPAPIFYKDRAGRYLGFNRAYELFFGAKREQLVGKSVFDTHPKELAEIYHARDLQVFEGEEEVQQYESQIKHTDGTLREVLFSKAAFFDAQGQVNGLIGAVLDITERKQAERALQENFEQITMLNRHLEESTRVLEEQTMELEASQVQLKDALEFSNGVINAIPDILFELDRNGCYLNVWTQNPEVLAAQKAALVGKTVHDVLSPEGADIAMAAIREAEECSVAYGHIIPVVQGNGEMRWYEHSLAKKYGNAPAEETFIVLSRDITGRKRVEQALVENLEQVATLNRHLEKNALHLEEQAVELEASQEQIKQTEAWYRGILHSAPDGMVVVNERGIITLVNEQLGRMFGYAEGELIGQPIEVLVPLGMRTGHLEKRNGFARRGGDAMTRMASNLRGCRKDGSEFAVDIALSRLPDVDTGSGAICAAVRDVSERVRLEQELAVREQEFRTLVENAPDVVVRYDRDCRRLYVNPAWERVNGLTAAEVIGKSPLELAGRIKPLAAEFEAMLREVMCTKRPGAMDLAWQNEMGEPVCFSLSAIPEFGSDNEVISVLTVARDISERKRMEAALAQREYEFRTLVENAADTVARYGHDGRRLYANPAFAALVDGGVDALLGKRPSEVPGGAHAEIYEEKLASTIASGEETEFELKWLDKNGREICSLINLTPEFGKNGKVESVLAVGRDISELHTFRQKIHQMAFFDPLTSLPNRALFNDRLRQMIADASWHAQLAGVMMIDMDRFKAVNDTMGHAVGDVLLRETGARLSACVRSYDTVARLGGDEFAVLLPDVRNAEDLGRIADKMRAVFNEPFLLEGKEVFVSCSIGIALYPNDSIAPDDLVKYADSAMYYAKRTGRNNFRFYSRDLTESANERLMLESELRRAVERGELELYYQPKVRLTDGKVIGSEALLRWKHPVRGMIPPDRFIPVAEDSGMIIEIGEWVLREACRVACERNGSDKALHKVAINLSARQFQSNDLVATLCGVLDETGCYPEWIELEITESLLLDEDGGVLDVLKAFRALGITIAIDDFGTGYSALSYLARFPINTLKVDRSFVRSIESDNFRAELVKAILSIAHCLGQQVVAEGVETPGQAMFLQAHGCQVAQGFLFSKPVPKAEFLAMPAAFNVA